MEKYAVLGLFGLVLLLGCAPEMRKNEDELMRMSTNELLSLLRSACKKKDVELTARTIITLGMTAQGSPDVDAALTDAFRVAKHWPLPRGVEWPDKPNPDVANPIIDAWGQRNVTLSFLIGEAVERIEARSDYKFKRPLFRSENAD